MTDQTTEQDQAVDADATPADATELADDDAQEAAIDAHIAAHEPDAPGDQDVPADNEKKIL